MFNKKITYFVAFLLLLGSLYGLNVVRMQGKPIDEALQREIEAKIPECQERDEAAKAIKEIYPEVYPSKDMDNYNEKSKSCRKEVIKRLRDRKI